MNDNFAPFELAVKLKEKGFDEECFGWYYPSEVCGFDYKTTIVFNSSEYRGGNYKDMLVLHKDEKHIDAPTISQVLKWLREEKKMHLMIDIWKVDFNDTTYKWGYDIVNLTTTEVLVCDTLCANSYEQAALTGIEYVLDNLI